MYILINASFRGLGRNGAFHIIKKNPKKDGARLHHLF